MYRRIIKAAGLSMTQAAEVMGISRQNLNSRVRARTLTVLFTIIKALDAKLVVEYKDGTRLDLTQYADDYRMVQRPDLAERRRAAAGNGKEGLIEV